MTLLAALLSAVLPAHAARTPRAPGAAQAELRRGLDAYMGARFDDAVEALTKALEADPGSKTAAGLRSICLWTTGDMAGARRDAAAAAALRPKDAESYAARGFARFVRRDFDGAASDFVAAAKRDRRYVLAYFGMGSVRSTQERLKEALTNLNLAARLKPDAAAVYIVRGTVLEKMKTPRRAIEDYTKAIQLAPDFKWAYFYRGRSYRDVQEWRKSALDLTGFLDVHPDFAQALYFRSNALYQIGDYRGAVKDLDRLLEHDAKNALALANRGVARAALGEKTQALADLRAARKLAPEKSAAIEIQIERIESGEAAAGPRPDADVEITGRPGTGLPARAAGEMADDAGIAAQPDLPAQEALPEEEPEAAPGAIATLRQQRRAARGGAAEPTVGTVSPVGSKPEGYKPPAPGEEPKKPAPPPEPRKPKKAPKAKPAPDELAPDTSGPAGPGEFMFVK